MVNNAVDEEKNLCFLNKTIGLHLVLSKSLCALHVTPYSSSISEFVVNLGPNLSGTLCDTKTK